MIPFYFRVKNTRYNEGDDYMFMFMILALILLLLIGATVVMVSAVGAVGIIIFGDVIVCGLIIALIIKKIFFKKKRK